MQLSFTLILAALVVSTANSQTLLNRACKQAQVALGLDTKTTCECTGGFKLGSGVTGDIECMLAQPQCLVPPNFYCAQGTFGAALQFSLLSGAGFSSNITGCFDIKSGFPPPLMDLGSLNQLCLVIVPDPATLSFGSCAVSLGGEACKCEICETGVDFKFDCSKVDVSGPKLPFIGGPVSPCIGLSLVPTNTTTPIDVPGFKIPIP